VPEATAATIYGWGGWTVLAIFISIWVCDSAAYFAGRAFGRHTLFERVSPKKTWEGAIAGFVGAIAAFVLMKELALPYLTFGQSLVCGVIVGVFGQLGDLVESLLKRDAGVKDSSSLIPGHGGVLDRFDSIMFVSPLLFLYLDFVVF
jgi:phosphatidate cytidylyltransferase